MRMDKSFDQKLGQTSRKATISQVSQRRFPCLRRRRRVGDYRDPDKTKMVDTNREWEREKGSLKRRRRCR